VANMSYCRFQNTKRDLSECCEHIEDRLGEDEARARVALVETCADILEACGFEVVAYSEGLGSITRKEIEKALAPYTKASE